MYDYELIHHRVTQSLTELNQFEIKRIELRETLCYSVVKTHFYTTMNESQLLIRIINKVNRIINVFSSPFYMATSFFIVPLRCRIFLNL